MVVALTYCIKLQMSPIQTVLIILLHLPYLRLRTTEVMQRLGWLCSGNKKNALQTMKWQWVKQYILSLFLEERNYQKNPTSNIWMLINLLAINQVMQYFPTVLVFFEILNTPSENWCFSRITANFFPCFPNFLLVKQRY